MCIRSIQVCVCVHVCVIYHIYLQGGVVLASKDGTYSQADYHGDSLVNISLREPVKLEVYTYTVHIVHFNSSRFLSLFHILWFKFV